MNLPLRCPSRLALGLSLIPALARAAPAQGDRWRTSVTPYLWATDVGIDVELDGGSIVDATIPVEDLLEDVDVTFQGHVEIARGAHGLAFDLFHVGMSDTASGFALPDGAGTGALDWSMDLTLADLAGVFDPRGDGRGVSFLYGLRLIDQRVDADATFATAGGAQSASSGASDTLVDALAGVRYRAPIGAHLTLQAQLDASTGGTDSTWSASPSLAWSFGEGRFALLAGYRHMAIDFGDEGGLESEMTLSGPVLGLRLSL
jgi:hypothetical protein